METEQNTAATVAELVKTHIAPYPLTLTHPDGTVAPTVILPGGSGLQMLGLDKMFEPYRTRPQRRTGKAALKDLPSFIGHVNRFSTSESALFADPGRDSPGILAVLDYHDRVNIHAPVTAGEPLTETNPEAQPRFGQHRAEYKFPLSEEWKLWNKSNKVMFDQASFAEFLEERVLEVLPVPTFSGELSAADQELQRLQILLDGRFAGPEGLMKLSRGLAIYETAKVVNATNLSSGEGCITYEEEHRDGEGQKLMVPNLFTIGIPVFEGGDVYRVVVRLRYRKKGPAIIWFYELYRHDRVFDDAVRGACAMAQAETGLPLFFGAPEA